MNRERARLAAQKGALVLLMLPGIAAATPLLRAWLEGWAEQPLVLWVPFGAVLLFSLGSCLLSWFLYLCFHHRPVPPAPPGLSVDVLVTACREPAWLVKTTLRAALRIRYPHATYLLDDGRDPALAGLAARLGVVYLTREGNLDKKAGNINAALPRMRGELLAVFDVDHSPDPDFLDRTLGFFTDEKVGFVQAMVTFSNARETWVAQGSAHSSYEYYNVSAVAKDRCGAAGLMGSNAVIRKEALDSIGGYRHGLAEDLETSLALHSRGWLSAYVAEPLAPGLTPADLFAFCKQQLKWSRGVFEAAVRSLQGPFFRLTLLQQLCYGLRFSYYLVGVGFFVNMSIVTASLFWPAFSLESVLLPWIPLVLSMFAVRFCALRAWGTDPEARRGLLFKGTSLVASAWPVYVASFACTLLRIRIPFIPTPKTAGSRLPPLLVLPQALLTLLLASGIVWRLLHWSAAPRPITLFFAVAHIGMHWMLVPSCLESRRSLMPAVPEVGSEAVD